LTTRSIHEFKDLTGRLGIDVMTMGTVMLPVEPFNLFSEGREDLLDVEELYVSSDPAKFWVNGDVSDKAHVTLHGGLLAPAYEQKANVDEVLADWDRPEWLVPEGITFFPSPYPDDRYAAIVATLDDQHIEEAHQRLSYLPHVDTFARFDQHMTLCYVRLEAAQKWMDVLSEAQFHIYVKDGLDYGEDK